MRDTCSSQANKDNGSNKWPTALLISRVQHRRCDDVRKAD